MTARQTLVDRITDTQPLGGSMTSYVSLKLVQDGKALAEICGTFDEWLDKLGGEFNSAFWHKLMAEHREWYVALRTLHIYDEEGPAAAMIWKLSQP